MKPECAQDICQIIQQVLKFARIETSNGLSKYGKVLKRNCLLMMRKSLHQSV